MALSETARRAWETLHRAEVEHDPQAVEVARRTAARVLNGEVDAAMGRVGLTRVMEILDEIGWDG